MGAHAAIPGVALARRYAGFRLQHAVEGTAVSPLAACQRPPPVRALAPLVTRTLPRSGPLLPQPRTVGSVERTLGSGLMSRGDLRTDVLVIGSGPGGATTAHLLAECG